MCVVPHSRMCEYYICAYKSICEGAELFTHPPVWASQGVSLADQRCLRLGQEQVGQPLPYVNNLESLGRNAFLSCSSCRQGADAKVPKELSAFLTA